MGQRSRLKGCIIEPGPARMGCLASFLTTIRGSRSRRACIAAAPTCSFSRSPMHVHVRSGATNEHRSLLSQHTLDEAKKKRN